MQAEGVNEKYVDKVDVRANQGKARGEHPARRALSHRCIDAQGLQDGEQQNSHGKYLTPSARRNGVAQQQRVEQYGYADEVGEAVRRFQQGRAGEVTSRWR
ncbi:MAG: hypothetical protein U0514_03680 [Candidatus Andersenbacteria bacterium]